MKRAVTTILTLVLVVLVVSYGVNKLKELGNEFGITGKTTEDPTVTASVTLVTPVVDLVQPTKEPIIETIVEANVSGENVKIKFSEQSYMREDMDGHKYKITVKLGPWMLRSNNELMDVAWGEVGDGKTLPTINALGLEKHRYNADGTSYYNITVGDKFAWSFSCFAANFDMYFAVGRITIENMMPDFHFSSENPKEIPYASFIISDSFETKNPVVAVKRLHPVICRVVYPSATWDSGYSNATKCIPMGGAIMEGDVWSAPFILMYGESFSPSYPDGLFKESLMDSELVFTGDVWVNDRRLVGTPYNPDETVTFRMSVLEP